MSRTLIVFAKEPLPGAVKTRLKSCFPETDLTRLYKAFIKDTLAIAHKTRNTKMILAFSSIRTPPLRLYPSTIELISGMCKITKPLYLESVGAGFELIEQKGRTLGDRMHNAFVYAHNNKSNKTVIIGTDSPTLPADMIEKAFRALSRKDVVIGPSVDGGYYLIGLKAPCAEIFNGVRWSSASVLKKTLDNAQSLGKTTALLEEWYDVDDRLSLKRLQDDLRKSTRAGFADHTRMALKNNHIL